MCLIIQEYSSLSTRRVKYVFLQFSAQVRFGVLCEQTTCSEIVATIMRLSTFCSTFTASLLACPHSSYFKIKVVKTVNLSIYISKSYTRNVHSTFTIPLYKSHIYLPITETVTVLMEMYTVMLSHDDVISRSLLIQDILSLPVALNIAKATEEPDENISILTCTIKMNKRQSAEGTQKLLVVVESNI